MRQKNPERVSVRGFFFVGPILLARLAIFLSRAGLPYFSTCVMTTCGIPASTNSSPSTLKPCAW